MGHYTSGETQLYGVAGSLTDGTTSSQYYLVRRCSLKPAFVSTEKDVVGVYDLLQPPCVLLCDLTTCCSMEIARFQRLKLKHDEPLSTFAFNFNVRRYKVDSRDCSWLMGDDSHPYASVRFTRFDTEFNFDFVEVFDGRTPDAPSLGRFSGAGSYNGGPAMPNNG